MYTIDAPMQPLHIVTERPIQWPTVGGSNAPGSVPVHALPVLVHNNIQLANKPASPPPHPTIAMTLTALPLSLQFSFNQVTLPTGATNVMSSYRVYRNTTANNFSGATLMRTFVHDPTRQGAITVQDNTGAGKNYYYFVTGVDTTSLESTPVGAQAGAVTSANANPNIAQATPSTVNPTTTSATYVVIPEMTATITATGNKILILFYMSIASNSVPGAGSNLAIFRDGSQLTPDARFDGVGTSIFVNTTLLYLDQPGAGSHTFDVRWKAVAGATLQGSTTSRVLQVVELG